MYWNIETTLFFFMFGCVIGYVIHLAWKAKGMFRKARELERKDPADDSSRMS